MTEQFREEREAAMGMFQAICHGAIEGNDPQLWKMLLDGLAKIAIDSQRYCQTQNAEIAKELALLGGTEWPNTN